MRYAVDGWVVEAAIRKGRALPDWATKASELTIFEQTYLTAFWCLSSERKYEGGPIPHSSMVEYCNIMELNYNLSDVLIGIVKLLDNEYRKLRASELSKSRNKKNPNKGQ